MNWRIMFRAVLWCAAAWLAFLVVMFYVRGRM